MSKWDNKGCGYSHDLNEEYENEKEFSVEELEDRSNED